jgi:hypothetical protein
LAMMRILADGGGILYGEMALAKAAAGDAIG